MSRRAEIEVFLQFLCQIEEYDEPMGRYYWPMGEQRIESGQCTNGARLVAMKFDGKVFGYHMWAGGPPRGQRSNPAYAEKVAFDCGGHDFALVDDRYLVDWWAAHVEGKAGKAIFDLEDPEDQILVAKLYLPRDQWESLNPVSPLIGLMPELWGIQTNEDRDERGRIHSAPGGGHRHSHSGDRGSEAGSSAAEHRILDRGAARESGDESQGAVLQAGAA